MQTEAAKRAKRRYYERNKAACLERSRAWGKENQDSRRASCKKYKIENPEKVRASARAWASRNKEHVEEVRKGWVGANPDKVRQHSRNHYWRHPERRRQQQRERLKANPAQRAFYQSMRAATKLKAAPQWVDQKQIRLIYKRAAEAGLTVDHIVPLKHALVCGLHVPWNLQLLTLSENASKGNRLDEALALAPQ